MYMYGNFGTGFGTLSLLLVFLIKFFVIVFIATLLIALAIATKNYIFSPADISSMKNIFTVNTNTKKHCETCGKVVESNWKVCPYCGTECNVVNTQQKEDLYEQPLV